MPVLSLNVVSQTKPETDTFGSTNLVCDGERLQIIKAHEPNTRHPFHLQFPNARRTLETRVVCESARNPDLAVPG